MSKLILFDTNILVHLVRESPLGDHVRQTYRPLLADPRPLISVVTEGELRSLINQWKWGKRKTSQARFLVQYFSRVPVAREDVFEAYAVLDAYSETVGHSMGKNDAWIAAAANVMDATLVTTDKDFDHLQPDFLNLDWIDPAAFKAERIGIAV